MKKRTLAIGDIHGCLQALKNLEEFVDFNEEDTIITLGDYIDRGPESMQVLDWLMEARQKYELITLLGNHERMMEDATLDAGAYYFWEMNGGTQTLRSFDCEVEDVPNKYWQFIKSCKLFHETESHIFVHAGLEPQQPPGEQKEDVLCWLRFGDLEPHSSEKTIVCGHTPQKSFIPGVLPHAICIDTPAFRPEGYLTCLDVDSGTYWQANSKGDTRKNTL